MQRQDTLQGSLLINKLTVTQQVKQLSAFSKTGGSLPCSQQPAACCLTYYSTFEYNLFETHFNIILPYKTTSSQLSLRFRFPHPNPRRISLFPIRATCPAHHFATPVYPYKVLIGTHHSDIKQTINDTILRHTLTHSHTHTLTSCHSNPLTVLLSEIILQI